MRRRIAFLVMLAAGVALYFTLAPRWPKDQMLHIVLGDAAPRVSEVRVRYAEPSAALAEDWTREVTFRYALKERLGETANRAPTAAPRVITHVARLADGDYLVETEVTSSANRITTTRRRVALLGGATSIDVSLDVLADAARDADDLAPEPRGAPSDPNGLDSPALDASTRHPGNAP